jgi:hypothetical protein
MIPASTFNACLDDMQTADEQLQCNPLNVYARACFKYTLNSIECYDPYLGRNVTMEAGSTEDN